MLRPDNSGVALPPDQAQRDLIHDELDRNILVEAAAGTGKTTSLVGRMVNLIRQGKCTVDKLAAVTYTRKAAAELRSRFQIALEKAAKTGSESERGRLGLATSQVERCFLGTIHSFCARLLRERPVEAGIDASFRELDDAEDQDLRQRAWLDYVAGLFASDDPVLAELGDLGIEIGNLETAFLKFAEFPDVDEWPPGSAQRPAPNEIIPLLRHFVNHLEELEKTFPDDLGHDKLMPRCRVVLRMFRQANWESSASVVNLLEEIRVFKTTDLVQKLWPGGKANAKLEIDHWNEFASQHAVPFVTAWREYCYGPVLRAIKPARDIYDLFRRESGGLNFQDLLLGAARLLRANSAVRRYFRNRFSHLLVDEFQDTDPVQAQVMLLLTADDPQETEWRRCRPVDGSLFVVGDPKQSIYRFRRADIVTYNEVKRIIEKNGGLVVSLSANFRSIEPLVEWINSALDKSFPEIATEYSPARCPLLHGHAGKQTGDLVGTYRLEISESEKNKSDTVEFEASLIARVIQDAIHAPRTVCKFDKQTGTYLALPARPGDFLIITKNRSNLSSYAKKLQELSIPHQVSGGSAVNESEELFLLYTCLRAVTRPDDPVCLVAALRSQLFGFSDRSLYAFKLAAGQFHYRSPVPSSLSAEDVAAFQDAFKRLASYAHWLAKLPQIAALQRIAGDLGLPARAAMANGGNSRAGNFATALELARLTQAKNLALADLVQYLGSMLKKEQKYDGMPVRPYGIDAVRLMNLHKAKGLEAAVVFLADPNGETEHDAEIHIDRSGDQVRGYLKICGPRLGNAPAAILAYPTEWEELATKEKRFRCAESDRLLYVAATRAGSCLIVAQRSCNNHFNPWQFFKAHLEGSPVPKDPVHCIMPSRPEFTITVEDFTTESLAIAERWHGLGRPTYDSEAIKEISVKGRVATLGPTEKPAGEYGAEWGSTIHALLEAAIRQPGADLGSLVRSLRTDMELTPEVMEKAVYTVQALQKSAIWKRAQASPRRLVEVPMHFLVPADQGTAGIPVVRRGVIDLIFHEPPKGWVIVDYKTDLGGRERISVLKDHYRPQVQAYGKAWEQIVGEPVHELGLYFSRLNQYVTV